MAGMDGYGSGKVNCKTILSLTTKGERYSIGYRYTLVLWRHSRAHTFFRCGTSQANRSTVKMSLPEKERGMSAAEEKFLHNHTLVLETYPAVSGNEALPLAAYLTGITLRSH